MLKKCMTIHPTILGSKEEQIDELNIFKLKDMVNTH